LQEQATNGQFRAVLVEDYTPSGALPMTNSFTVSRTGETGVLWFRLEELKFLLRRCLTADLDFPGTMNELGNLNLPPLLPTRPQRMLERAKTSGLIVPLPGYRV
jgi:hypothetical protein